jgi:hypothetical protein
VVRLSEIVFASRVNATMLNEQTAGAENCAFHPLASLVTLART